jgi:hypothetical protein
MDTNTILIVFLLIVVPLNIWILVRFVRMTTNIREIKEILMAAHSIEAYETNAKWVEGVQQTEYAKGFRKIQEVK